MNWWIVSFLLPAILSHYVSLKENVSLCFSYIFPAWVKIHLYPGTVTDKCLAILKDIHKHFVAQTTFRMTSSF